MIPAGVIASGWYAPSSGVPEVIGVETGAQVGIGTFTVTPPAGASGYLALVSWRGGDLTGIAPTGWTPFADGYGNPGDEYTRWAVWLSNSAPGSSWYNPNGSTGDSMSVVVIGYSGPITVDAYLTQTNTESDDTPTTPSVTTSTSALILRAMLGDVWGSSSGSAYSVTYPSGHTLGQTFKYGASYDSGAVAVAHATRSSAGATGTADFTLAGGNAYYLTGLTMALKAA